MDLERRVRGQRVRAHDIPAAYAVAFTNAEIVLAGIIAMTWYREREHWRARLAAMLVVCAGLYLLALR